MARDSSNPLREFESWLAPITTALALLLASLAVFGREDFCLDDAWIHLSYAKNIRSGFGLSYNPNDYELGFSSPLWIALLSLWPINLAQPVFAVKLLGTLLFGATVWINTSLALLLGKKYASVERPIPLAAVGTLAGVLTAVHPELVLASTSGMEVPLAAALLSSCVYASLGSAPFVLLLSLGVMGIWARPELLGPIFAFESARFFFSPSKESLTLVWKRYPATLGALIGLLIWVVYCFIQSEGYVFPNTAYIKGGSGGIKSIQYLSEHVLAQQPWIISLGGIALLAAALWGEKKQRSAKHFEVRSILAAWVFGMLFIAFSRPLHPGVLFYESRYFTPLAALPIPILSLGLAYFPRRWAWIALLPIALVSSLLLFESHELQQELEDDVRRLHRVPATWIARNLPPNSVVAVEGAGAHRYFSPSSMKLIDIIGLNDKILAHLPSDASKICEIASRQPSYFVLPDPLARTFVRVFKLKAIQQFSDPAYHQSEKPYPLSVTVFENEGLNEKWAQRCAHSNEALPQT